MANFNLKKGMLKLNAERFSGINVDKNNDVSGDMSAYNIRNFRITDDGKLKKRCGYKPTVKLPHALRGMWNGYINKTYFSVAVADNKVYYVDISTNSYTVVGTLDSDNGKISFVNFLNALYIFDDFDIYRCLEEEIVPVHGYAPLIRKNCDPNTGDGEDFELPNFLTGRVRARYDGFSTDSTYLIHDDVASFDGVIVNGVALETSEYRYFPSSGEGHRPYVELLYSVPSGAYVELGYTRAPLPPGKRQRVLSATQSIICDTLSNDSRLLLFGYGGERKNTVFYSLPPAAEDYMQSCLMFGEEERFYYTSETRFDVGEGAAITASCYFEDKILFFTDTDIWQMSASWTDFDFTPVSLFVQGVGSANANGAIALKGDVVFLGKGKIYELSKDKYFPNEVNPESISENIRNYISEQFCASAIMHLYKNRSELWIAYQNSVWIYNYTLNVWYSFDGFSAKGLYEINGEIAFYDDDCIFIFDENENCDIVSEDDVRPINAVWESGFIDFGKKDSYKRLHRCSFTVISDGGNGNMNFEIISDRGISCKLSPAECPKSCECASGFPKLYKMRMSVGRFCNIKFILSSDDAYRPIISNFSLYAQL